MYYHLEFFVSLFGLKSSVIGKSSKAFLSFVGLHCTGWNFRVMIGKKENQKYCRKFYQNGLFQFLFLNTPQCSVKHNAILVHWPLRANELIAS